MSQEDTQRESQEDSQGETKEEKPRCPEFSMEEWIGQEDPYKDDPELCRPCRLGVIANWYFNELEDQGHKELAVSLEKIANKEDDPELPLTLCKEFDRIKDTVEEPLRERLKDFDCATQSFNPDDVVEDEQQQQHQNLVEEGTQDE